MAGLVILFSLAFGVSILEVDVQDGYVFNQPKIIVKVNCTSCVINDAYLTNNTPNSFSYEMIFVPHYLVNETGIIEFLVERQNCTDLGKEYNYTVHVNTSEGNVSEEFLFTIGSPLEIEVDKSVVTTSINEQPRIHLTLKNKGSSPFQTNVSVCWDKGVTKVYNAYGFFLKNFSINLSSTLMNTLVLLPNSMGKGELTINVTTNCSAVNASQVIPTSVYSVSGALQVRTLDFLEFIFNFFKPLLLS